MALNEDDDIIKYERNLEKPTTHLNDYRWPVLDSEPEDSYIKPVTSETEKNSTGLPSLKIPFDFYFKPKSVNLSIREALDELKEKPVEDKKFDRPRIYKCPEVSLDDVPDKDMRDMIIKFVYTSETHNFMEESMKAISNKESNESYDDCINTSLMLNENEKLLKDLKACELTVNRMGPTSGEIKPLGWENHTGKEWDHTQKTFLGQPTKNFWMKKKIHGPDYDPTKIPMSCEHNLHVIGLLKEDKVRLPHLSTKYGGFKPKFSHKIALEKDKPDMFDFWYTTNQCYGKHYLSNKSQC